MKSKNYTFTWLKLITRVRALMILFITSLISDSILAQTKEMSVGSGVLFTGATANLMYKKYKPDFQSASRVIFSTFDLSMETKHNFPDNVYNIKAIDKNLQTDKLYSFGLGLTLGKQKNVYSADKLVFYRGFDAGFHIFRTIYNPTQTFQINASNDTLRITGVTKRESVTNNITLTYAQFLGVRYQLMPNLSLSLEPSFNLHLSRYSFVSNLIKYTISDYSIDEKKVDGSYNSTVNYRFNYYPYARFWIAYTLKGKSK